MKSPRKVKLLALAMVLGLGVSTPTSTHALLTELVVAGTVISQLAGIVAEALPALSTLAGSVTKVVKDGQQIGETFGRIVDIFLPKKKGDGEPGADRKPRPRAKRPAPLPLPRGGSPTGAGGATAAARFDLPTLSARPGAGGEAPGDPREAEIRGDDADPEEDTLTRLLTAWDRQQGLQGALEAASEEDRPGLEEGLMALSKAYEQAVEDLSGELKKAAEEGQEAPLEALVETLGELEPARREALRPVLESLSGRGANFEVLYSGKAGDAAPQDRALRAAP